MITIIAVLMAVLIPALHRARTQTRRVVCASQLRQLSNGWSRYLDDNRGAFLQDAKQSISNADINYGGKRGEGAAFRGNKRSEKPLNKYTGCPPRTDTGAEVFRCPGETGGVTCYTWYGTSYRMNRMLVGNGSLQIGEEDPCAQLLREVNLRLKGLNRSVVSDSWRLVLMGDFEWDTTYQPTWDVIGTTWHGDSGRFNMAFLDQHVGYVEIRKGRHTTSEYTVIPFEDLIRASWQYESSSAGEGKGE